ncbi:MAG: YchF-related putative GTPase [Candidatus Micrarchaeia archaeon]
MFLGIVGKPSSGKSTFFSAATGLEVKISPRPFTTVDPNKGITFITVKCPCKEFELKCNPINSKCENGLRYIPINLEDLLGIVPNAHLGKGLGNKFLDEVRSADVLIHVIDISGTTDSFGNPTEDYDPEEEIKFVENEIILWIAGIIKRAKNFSLESIAKQLTGLKIKKEEIEEIYKDSKFDDEGIIEFSKRIKERSMPSIIAANKIDLDKKNNFERLKEKYKNILPVYAEGELALVRASKKGIINYNYDGKNFEILRATKEQEEALEKIRKVISKYGSTGVRETIKKAFFDLWKGIVVYPVNDETHFTDTKGNVLPDAIPVKEGTKVIELAEKIHSDLAKNFLFAIDARRKIRIGKEYELKDGDVIKIVAAK